MSCRYKPIALTVLLCILFDGFVCCQSKGRVTKSVLENQNKGTPTHSLKKDKMVNPPVLYNRLNSAIGPEDIRVVARILSIRNSNSSLEAPCNQFRCVAEILIEEVIERGRTYYGNLEAGRKAMAFFPMTIEPTVKVYPGVVTQQVFSGLKLNELFEADVSGAQAIDQAETSELKILTYKLVK
jgi:hypothetical protein